MIPILVCLVLAASAQKVFDQPQLSRSDVTRSFKAIVKHNGYDVEEYRVMTEDRYWLKLYRIPGKNGEETTGKPVVFLQAGMLDSSDTWVMNRKELAPAFILSDKGYDVWLGNTRGNKESKDHMQLDPEDPDDMPLYWTMSFEEKGYFDIPAMIEFTLRMTKQKKLSVIAHSQATASMYYALTTDKLGWFQERVENYIALGPVARMDHCEAKLLTTVAH